MNKILMKRSSVIVLAGLWACGEDMGPQDSGTEQETQLLPGEIETRDAPSGGVATQVNASDTTEWVYVDLDVDRGAVLDIAHGGESTAWDVAFRRSNIKVNGGHSGPANVAVAAVPQADFNAMTRTPVALFEADQALNPEDENPDQPDFINSDGTDFVFGRPNAASNNGWFDYDPVNHVLSPADVVFVIRTTEGAYVKFAFLGYYSEAGSSGFPTFRWAPIDGPMGPRAVTVDASGREDFIFLNLDSLSPVTVDDAQGSMEWDLALRRTLIRTNGGASGPGFAGGLELPDADFEGVESAPTVGFETDVMLPVPGPGGQTAPANEVLSSWFDYDPATRTVSVRPTLFVVRDAQGNKHKVQVDDWNDGVFELRVQPVPPKPDIMRVELPSAEARQHFSLRLGRAVEVDAPADSLAWDLAIEGDQVFLNGGSNGPGEAALAPASEGSTLADVVVVPEDDAFSVSDGAESNLSGQDGSGVFIVRLADGSFGKLQLDLSGTVPVIDFAYAGPVRRSFR